MIKLGHGILFAAISLTAPVHAAEQSENAEPELSEAEVLLWMTNQLGAVTSTMELVYTFERSGSLEPGFSDQVRFDIEKINDDGTKSASVEFFTGERNFPVPPATSTSVNPILKVFLQGDVLEMNRLSDPNGSARERWRYFQRRIKYALADTAVVESHTFDFDGRSWRGQKIYFQPYTNDPKRNLFERYADKAYTFIVSDELPGYLYRIETVIPDQEGRAPLVREVLELAGIHLTGGSPR